MRALVTGATGFVGSHLCQELASRSIEVVALHREGSDTRWLRSLQCLLAVGDIRDGEAVSRALSGVNLIFHAAGLVKAVRRRDLFSVNRGGAEVLVQALRIAKTAPRRLVLVSSLAARGPSPSERPPEEGGPDLPVSAYGQSKLEGERALIGLTDTEVTVIRPPIVYGARDPNLLLVFRAVRSGLVVVPGGGERHYSVVHVSDLVRGMVDAGLHEGTVGRTYTLCDGRVRSWGEIIEAMRIEVRPGARTLRMPLGVIGAAALLATGLSLVTGRASLLSLDKLHEIRARAWVCSSDRARTDFGYEARVPFEEGIRSTAEWYRREGWLRAGPAGS